MRAFVLLVAALAACRGGGAAIVLPPAQVTAGLGAPIRKGGRGARPERRDPRRAVVGIARVAADAHRRRRRLRRLVPPARRRDRAARPSPAGDRPFGRSHAARNGGYLDLAYALANDAHTRTWLSWRGELLSVRAQGQHLAALGAALRVSTELYARGAFASGGSGAGIAQSGSWAIGAYVEASGRELPAQLGPASVVAGFVVRVPLFVAAAR